MTQAPVAPDPAFGTRTSTPYAGTTGHAGTGASSERAYREAADGTATARQATIVALLSDAGPVGMTWAEIGRRTGEHHGQVSGALSSMHKEGRVAVVKGERRDRSGVYVLPTHLNGRDTVPFKGKGTGRSRRDLEDSYGEAVGEIERLRRVLEANKIADDGMQFSPSPFPGDVPDQVAVANDMAVTTLEIERLTAQVDQLRTQNGEQAVEIQRLTAERDAAEATFTGIRNEPGIMAMTTTETKAVHRERLTDEERTLVDNIESGLPRFRDRGVVNLRFASAQMVVAALRRLDQG